MRFSRRCHACMALLTQEQKYTCMLLSYSQDLCDSNSYLYLSRFLKRLGRRGRPRLVPHRRPAARRPDRAGGPPRRHRARTWQTELQRWKRRQGPRRRRACSERAACWRSSFFWTEVTLRARRRSFKGGSRNSQSAHEKEKNGWC